MRRAAVPLVAALAMTTLAGCGSGSAGTTQRHFSFLCVAVGLPLSGRQGSAGRGVLTGLRRQIPTAGLKVGGYRIRLCRAEDGAAGVVSDATAAAEDVRTIAYVGELSADAASMAEAVLGQAGIALITPSGAQRSTLPHASALYLLPAARTQAEAVAVVRARHGCARRRRGTRVCSVISSITAPLCTGIAASVAAAARLCVLAGPDLSGGPSPAVAYGDSIGQLLVLSLRAIARGGGDVADRRSVLAGLLGANLRTSPIGAIRFDRQGAMESDLFTAYTVRRDGGLVLPRSFRTH